MSCPNAILCAATVGASPRRVLTRKGRDSDPEGWSRFLPAVPLLSACFVALATLVWALVATSTREGDKPPAVPQDPG
jgi:hypothetical protein